MAIQQIGIKMFVSGASRMARDISHISLALYGYNKALNTAEKGALRLAQSSTKASERQLSSAVRSKQAVEKALQRQIQLQDELSRKLNNLRDQSRNYDIASARITLYTNKIERAKSAISLAKSELASFSDMMKRNNSSQETYNRKIAETALRLASMSANGKQNTKAFRDLQEASKRYLSILESLKVKQTEYQTSIDNTKKRLDNLRTAQQRHIAKLKELNDAVGDSEQIQKEIASTEEKLEKVEQELVKTRAELASKTDEVTRKTNEFNDAQQSLNDILEQTSGFLGSLRKVFSNMTGQFGVNIAGATKLDTALLKMGLQAAALGVALNLVVIALDAVAILFTLVLGAAKLVWNIFTKLLGVVFSLGKAIGGALFKGLKAIITLPFKIAIDGLTGIWNSIKRIGEIAIGMNISNLIWNLGTKIKDLGLMAVQAASDFQLLNIRLTGLFQREISRDKGIPFAQAFDEASKSAEDLSLWISRLAVQSIYSAEDIANTFTLAMAYDMTSEEAKKLTVSIMNFATGMGLGNDEMRRIIENFGQMRAQGKITGTELRDLARGAFVPTNRVLEIMGQALGLDTDKIVDLKKEMQDMTAEGKTTVDDFFKAFITMTEQDFPNAVGRASKSFEVVKSNIKDFIQSVIGWRVITPTLDVISERMTKFVSQFMGDEIILFAKNLGIALGGVASIFGKLSDKLTPKFLGNLPKFADGFNKVAESLTEMFDILSNPTREGLSRLTKLRYKLINSMKGIFSIFNFKGNAVKFSNQIEDLFDTIVNLDKMDFPTAVSTLKEKIKPILQTVWDAIFKPAVEKGKEKFKEIFESIFNKLKDEILPKLWEKIKPVILDLLGKFGEWIQSEDAQELGAAVSGFIKSAFDKMSGNAQLLTDIKNVVIALLSGALSGALDFVRGMFSVEDVFGGGVEVPDIKGGQFEMVDQETKLGGLSGAIADLKNKAREALDTSLAEFKDWFVTFPTGASIVETLDNIKQFMFDLNVVAGPLVDPLNRIADALLRIKQVFTFDDGGGETQKGGVLGALDYFLKSNGIVKQLELAAGFLETIASSVERLKEVNPGGENFLQGIADFASGNPVGGVGNFVQGMFDNAKPLIDKIKGLFTDTETSSTETTDAITSDWVALDVALVSGSIIPDMLTAIYDVFVEKLTETLDYVRNFFIEPLKTLFNELNFYEAGVAVVSTFWDGMFLLAYDMLSWWQSIMNELANISSVTPSPGVVDNSTPSKKPASNGAQKVANPGQGGIVAAKGANFIVPPGFPNDTFTVGVSTGEHVVVVPNVMSSFRNQSRNNPRFTGLNVSGGMGNSFSNIINKNFNLNVATQMTTSNVTRQFGIMQMMEAG